VDLLNNLIKTRLTQPEDEDEDLNVEINSSDESEEENENDKKPKAKQHGTPLKKGATTLQRSSPWMLKKMEEFDKSSQEKPDYELSINRTVSIAFQECEEKIVVVNRGHSMFMNCVPMTKINLRPNVLAKIHSVVQNTLFKSAKFYPQPSHANNVVGICLYDCGFFFPGVEGNWIFTRHWDAIRNKANFQTGIYDSKSLFVGTLCPGVSRTDFL